MPMSFLEYVLVILLMLVSVAVIVGFFIYTGLDKRRFRIERQLDKVLPIVKKWVTEVQLLSEAGILGGAPDVPEACRRFLSTKKLMPRLEALAVLSDHSEALVCRLGEELSGEQAERYADMLEYEHMLRDFFSMYPIMAGEYNKRLEKPVYAQGGKLMRFRPAPALDGLCV